MNGKLRIELDGKEIKLWFNRFSEFEMKNFFKGENLLKAIEDKVKENEMAFIADLIWIGVVGQREATLEDTQMSRKDIRMAIAEASLDDLARVSNVFFKAMGQDLEQPKKKAEKKPTKKQSRSKAS